MPHAEAMKLYAQADLVIDQLLAGWYGGFAVEMMAMGKPVVCYIRAEDLRFVPPGMVAELPLVPARPDSLEDDLEAAIARRSEWPAWGRRGREFALRWHHPRRIAQAMIDIYRDPRAPLRLASDEAWLAIALATTSGPLFPPGEGRGEGGAGGSERCWLEMSRGRSGKRGERNCMRTSPSPSPSRKERDR